MKSASRSRRRARLCSLPASALICVGLAGCAGIFQGTLPDRPESYARQARAGVLRAGAAEADITPPGAQYMGGYSLARTSKGVLSPLKARALVLELGSVAIAIVGVDNLGLQREDSDWIKSGIAGIPNGNVFLCSSHTHAAPDLIGLWGAYFLSSGRDREYLSLVRRQVAAAVAAAWQNARPARLLCGDAWLPPREVVKNSNRTEVFDRRLSLLHAVDAQSKAPLGTLLHLSCHPEVMRRDNELLSSDFVGELCERWQKAGLGQAVFVNGALGAMITPAVRPTGPPGLPIMGAKLLELAQKALAEARELAAPALEVRRRDVFLALEAPGLVLGRLSLAIPRALYSGRARTTVGYLRVGELEIATVPGEIEPGLATRLRLACGRPRMWILGLVDDELGYLMSEQDARDAEFRYERSMSPCAGAGERVVEALVR